MRLYKVRVRRWHRSEKSGELKDGVWCDESVLVEANDIDHSWEVGFEVIMRTKFFGVNPDECEVMQSSGVTLPIHL